MLILAGVTVSFGPVVAVDDVSLRIAAGSRHGLIGPNGAGKSTLLAAIAGTVPARGGCLLAGRELAGLPPHRRARLGVGRTHQQAATCATLTALDNVLLGLYRQAGPLRAALRPALRRALTARATEALATVGLVDRATVTAGALSYGERRCVELAAALATDPRLLLLDEPAAGLAPAEVDRLARLLADLPAATTVLIVEHDLDLVFGLTDTVTVLDNARHLVTGTPAEVRSSPVVRDAFAGVRP
ncbi:ABC transporter ATP-binding protein [Longispora fulva]|uniref:Branched-chain amino acid transport system ATP-binding protein n=1 Tax=Longispora fulva TaxID=619741 RepID=A0A8J7KML8_9ACTN|nr:ABC transporter ATP-binding protein [Longispora fulva]MBG6134157.1 branched-chain amino acid transport system ATP-binding protein [Longispora fulva]GIG62530.1 ABC transporter ATP-binding protein [Longispora fulva]